MRAYSHQGHGPRADQIGRIHISDFRNLRTISLAKRSRSIHLGHVWTAPWQELSDVSAALVGCGHVSGLLMRQVWPLALMLCADWVPIVSTHFYVR